MFEKDEDYRKARKESKDRITKVIKAWCAREEVIHDKGFEQGAEFGYQESLKAKINATTISDCPHKDEWHYPSKGEYPTTEEEVLVYLWDSFYIGTYCLDSSEINRWHFNDFDEQSDQITAWCYIKPPKEEE